MTQAPIGHHFDRALGQQQIDQHPVVVFRVPHTELAEQRDRALARRGLLAQIAQWQAGFHTDADLAAVCRFARGNVCGEPCQALSGQHAARIPLVPQAMLEES